MPILLPVPHLQQLADGDCLPACAFMVLTYMGKKTRFWRLRWLLGTKSFGTPFLHIRHLQQLGITVEVQARGTLSMIQNFQTHRLPLRVMILTLPG
jgi:ABC-type bacteriocin/lantibiotic exporter with double-glycine peptidase domain